MSKQIYTLVEWDTEKDTETFLKSFADEKSATAEMKKLEVGSGPRILHFIVETELVGG